MTIPAYVLVTQTGCRLLRSLPGWSLSKKGTSLFRRVGGAHVSVYTKPAQRDGPFYVKIEVPVWVDDETDAAAEALALASRALGAEKG